MNRDRIAGSAKQTLGNLKVVAGKALGDSKLVASGQAEKIEGRIQSAVGGLKDALKP